MDMPAETTNSPAVHVAVPARIFPEPFVQALLDASGWPPAQRIARIDEITDQLARRDIVRARSHCRPEFSARRMKQWIW